MIDEDVFCECGHDMDYHDEDGCYHGMCKCRQTYYLGYWELLYEDRGLSLP